tara:strand:- start:832 stop:1080 length:249 start_codon:yes stop_codon:yes gene_type:complete
MPQKPEDRNYRKEYDRDHSDRKAKRERARRNKLHRELDPPQGKEVDHKVPISKGGSDSKDNIRVVDQKTNRRRKLKYRRKKK